MEKPVVFGTVAVCQAVCEDVCERMPYGIGGLTMSSIDWEQEFIQLRREAEELAATGIGKEAGIRASGAIFARMLLRTGAWAPEDIEVEPVFAGFSGDIVGYEIGPLIIQYGPCYLHRFTWLVLNQETSSRIVGGGSGLHRKLEVITISACVNRADLAALQFTLPISQHARLTPLSKH